MIGVCKLTCPRPLRLFAKLLIVCWLLGIMSAIQLKRRENSQLFILMQKRLLNGLKNLDVHFLKSKLCWLAKLGEIIKEQFRSTSVGRSIDRSSKLLERHIEFERVCQNTYQNVNKLLDNGKSLAKQFREYHTQIGQKCHQLQGNFYYTYWKHYVNKNRQLRWIKTNIQKWLLILIAK